MDHDFEWDRPRPFVIDVVVDPEHADGYGHVSTYHFVEWLIDCAFAHSAAVGLPEETCRESERGMAVRDMRVELLGSAYAGDRLKVANWVSRADGKLKATRQFQIINTDTGQTLLRAEFDSICTNLKTGRPVKMPPLFARRYVVE